MKPEIYPANKVHFMRLIPFAQKIIAICREAGIRPVIYGSYAHFYHTRDEKMKVNDIDLWIPENKYPALLHLLTTSKIKYHYVPEWHTLIIKNGKLRVEVDSIDFWYRDLKKKPFEKVFDSCNFYGVEVQVITLKNLEKFYQVALVQANTTKKKVALRIQNLETYLGRTLR